MPKFPVDAPKARVIHAFELLGFRLIREREHIAMSRQNPHGMQTPLTLPNHARIKEAALRAALTQAGIPQDELLAAYDMA